MTLSDVIRCRCKKGATCDFSVVDVGSGWFHARFNTERKGKITFEIEVAFIADLQE